MRPFNLDDDSILSEAFKKDFKIKDWPAGAFDYELTMVESTAEETDVLCEWLSTNCTDNFIVARDSSQILAGGCSDNALSWKKRHSARELITEIRIRLHESDIMLFRMAWLP
jgi:hypothetical protein